MQVLSVIYVNYYLMNDLNLDLCIKCFIILGPVIVYDKRNMYDTHYILLALRSLLSSRLNSFTACK